MADTWMIGVIYIVFKSDIGQGIFIHHSSYSGNLPMIEDDIYIFEWWVTEHLEYRLYNSCSNLTMYTWRTFWIKTGSENEGLWKNCEQVPPCSWRRWVTWGLWCKESASPQSLGVFGSQKSPGREKCKDLSWILPGKNCQKKLKFYLKYWHWPCWLSAHKVLLGCWSSR